MEYPFKDLMPLDEVTARDGYYKDWTHIDADTFHQIAELVKFIREKGYGSDTREAIAQALERVYHDAIESGNANMELSMARKHFKDLASRLDASDDKLTSTTAQLAQKANKSGVREDTGTRPINVNEMDTETKQLFTGGAVAVVGEDAVGRENIKNGAVSAFNTGFIEQQTLDGTAIQAEVYQYGEVWYVAHQDGPITSHIFNVAPKSYVSIKNFVGANRFRVVILKQRYTGGSMVADRLINSDDSKSSIDFYNSDGVQVVVYSANTDMSPLKPTVRQISKIKTEVPFDLERQVDVSDTTFFDSESTPLPFERKVASTIYKESNGMYSLMHSPVETVTYRASILPNQNITVKVTAGEKSAFRVALMESPFLPESPTTPVGRLIIDDLSSGEVSFVSGSKEIEMWVYLGLTQDGANATISVDTEKIVPIVPIKLDRTIEIEDTTFLSRQYTDIPYVKRSDVSLRISADGKVSINPGDAIKSLTYTIDLEPFQTLNVAITGGVYKRFRAAVTDVTVGAAPVLTQIPVDEVITLLDSSNNFEYKNGESSRRVWLYLGLEADGVDATISATVQKIVPNIPFANTDTQKTVERSFGLEYTTVSEDTGLPTNVGDYPSMCAVKMDNSRSGEHPRPVGWLYRSDTAPYTFYYSSVTPDNMKEIFEWDASLAGSTYNTPEYYSPFVTKYGDVVFVFRGDRLSTLTDNEPINPDARRNPIVYPASDYSNPVVVDVGEVKPTAWLQNCGADYIYNQDTFMFSEYTRPLHGNAYVWKVSEPVASSDSWQISKTFELSGSMNIGMKHSHTVNYDPYSELIFMTTGDDSSAAKIFSSADNGVSWQVQMENSEKHCRVLNFVFKEDKIYWATDSGKVDLHFFFEVPRDPVTKIPDFSNIKELYKFKNKSGQQATYVTVSIDKPSGILFLDRYDNNTVEPMEIYFWSFETSSMHILDYLTPVGGVPSMFGFRVEAINWYQSIGKDKRIVMGYGHPPNDNALLGNKINNRINNLALEVKEVVEF